MTIPFHRQLDEMYAREIVPLRAEFAAVDRADPAALRAWFERYDYLSRNDLACIAGVTLRTLRRWRNMAGFPLVDRRPPTPYPRLPRPALVAPPDWRAGRWLADHYPRHGVRAIARAIGRSYTATRRLLRRRGLLPGRRRPPRHPCATREWLRRHYTEAGLSLSACARRAGVGRATMTDWLVRAGARVRSNGEQQMLRHHPVAPAAGIPPKIARVRTGARSSLTRGGIVRDRRDDGGGSF